DLQLVGNSSGTNNDGIKFQNSATGGKAIGNKIHHIGLGNCSGGAPIISAATNGVIDSNFLYDYGQAGCNQYEAVYINDGNGQTVTNNIIGSTANSPTTGIQVNGQQAQVANFPSNETVANNTLFNVGGWGTLWASWSGTASGNKFNNNIIYAANVSGCC